MRSSYDIWVNEHGQTFSEWATFDSTKDEMQSSDNFEKWITFKVSNLWHDLVTVDNRYSASLWSLTPEMMKQLDYS